MIGQDFRGVRGLMPRLLGWASAIPAMIGRRRSRQPAVEHFPACIMASSLFVRANGDLSCWCDNGKNTQLATLTETQLRAEDFRMLELPALVRIRQAFMDGELPHPQICDRCVMAKKLLPTQGGETCRFLNQIHLEPSILCRLRCLDCNQLRNRSPYLMPLPLFQAMLDNLRRQGVAGVGTFIFEGLGEPLMNPELARMIVAAKRSFPGAEAILTTNGNFEFSEELGRSPLDCLRVSIDGVDQASYQLYRRGGDFKKAMTFLRDAAQSRQRTGTPRSIEWRYILFEWNDSDDQISTVAKLARELDVNCSFDMSFAPDVTKRFTPDTLDARLAEIAPNAANISRVRTDR